MIKFQNWSKNKLQVFLLFVFVLSGKYDVEILNQPIQVRYFILILLLLMMVSRLRYSVFRINIPLFSILIFCSTLILSVTWNLGGSYALEYMFDLSIMVLIIVLVGVTFKTNDDINLLLYMFTITGFLYSVLSIASVFAGERASLLLGGPNVTVRIIFLGLLAHLQVGKSRNYNFVLIILLLVGIISTGSRGGMVSSLICLTLYSTLIIYSKFHLRNIRISMIGLVRAFGLSLMLFYIYASFQEQVDSLINERIIETLIDNVHLAGRDDLYLASVSVISKNIYFGQGLASYYDNEVGFHPHNLFLQLYLDVGLLSIINIAIIFLSLFSFIRNRYEIIFYAIPFYLIVHMVSGSYYDLRYMFIFWMLGGVMHKINSNA